MISQSRYIVILDVKAHSVIYESNHISNNIKLIPPSGVTGAGGGGISVFYPLDDSVYLLLLLYC